VVSRDVLETLVIQNDSSADDYIHGRIMNGMIEG
jgi:hypothetical protein